MRKVRRAVYTADDFLFDRHLLATILMARVMEFGGLVLLVWWAFHHVTITIK